MRLSPNPRSTARKGAGDPGPPHAIPAYSYQPSAIASAGGVSPVASVLPVVYVPIRVCSGLIRHWAWVPVALICAAGIVRWLTVAVTSRFGGRAQARVADPFRRESAADRHHAAVVFDFDLFPCGTFDVDFRFVGLPPADVNR